MSLTLDSPIATVLGRSDKKQRDKFVVRLGLETVGDLLRHFPRRYVDTTSLTTLSTLNEGQLLTVVGEIVESKVKTFTNRRTNKLGHRVVTTLATDGPRLHMTFFAANQGMAGYFAGQYRPGARGLFIGAARKFAGDWQLTNPKAVLFGPGGSASEVGADGADDGAVESLDLGPLFPIYPLTKGIDAWEMQRVVRLARDLVEDPRELIPDVVRDRFRLLDVDAAYAAVHAPRTKAEVEDGRRYFRFEEALVTQVVLARRRRAARQVGAVARDGGDRALLSAFDAQLPFQLTVGQRYVGTELAADLGRSWPMNRLLQGEVGSGKTLVALRAMLHVVDSGGQAALLAPTEVLAQQHHRSMLALLGELGRGGMLGGLMGGPGVELLTGSLTKTARTAPMSRLASGESGIVVGTHALLEDQVQFADLGLVVVDEQHRFGVEQRAALTDKAGSPPHVLVMTATPIPRTVAMTVFGDLETSLLTELPAGRAPIQTNVVDLVAHPAWLDRVWARVREEVEAGHRAFVVCPRISGDEAEAGVVQAERESDAADASQLDDDAVPDGPEVSTRPPLAAVADVVERLSAGPLAGLRVGALHGRMPPEEKDAAMQAFGAGELDVLVATTVIEVGVDVPEATAMVVLDADRFGVSQLHQLRGRVGRGGLPGLCLLVSHAPPESPAAQRLAAVAATTDGFELSEVDLELRREGDVLGSSQSGGRSTLRTLKVLRDEPTIREAREAADLVLDADPDLVREAELARAVARMEASVEADFLERS